MNKETTYIGIDVSKAVIDLCVLQGSETRYYKLKNEAYVIRKWFDEQDWTDMIICMENTGRYNWPVYGGIIDLEAEVYVVNPLHIKRSLGMVRGKDDQIDAMRIARFIQKNAQELTPWVPDTPGVKRLKILLSERKMLIKTRTQKVNASKHNDLLDDKSFKAVRDRAANRVKNFLNREIKLIDAEIQALIKSDEELNQQAELIQSVPSVGPVTAAHLLAKTNCFTSLNDPRKLACYIGVVPFSYSSGTSINSKSKVSHLADKALKHQLHLCAMSAMRFDPDIAEYYQRKVAEGKNKMLILNNIRNKIVHRICAVIRDQRKWEKRLILS